MAGDVTTSLQKYPSFVTKTKKQLRESAILSKLSWICHHKHAWRYPNL